MAERILIVDDHPLTRSALAGLLQQNGFEVVGEAGPSAEVVVLTASGTEDNLMAAIRGGAAGYLLKSEPPERIVEFLRGVAEGEAALSGSVARRLLEQLRDGRGAEGWVPDSIAGALSARELDVLLLLDDHLS